MVQDINTDNLENNPSVKYGKFLAHPPPGEEICISGMSGNFPLCENIDEFKDNLYNKVNMISNVCPTHPEIPPGLGKLKQQTLTHFDSGFFGIHRVQAKTMNQMTKLLLECCVEAIFDAGLQPSDLEGTRTGVYAGICFTESECYWYPLKIKNGSPITGNMKAAIANRISYFLKLKGPSFNNDTACSSTSFALEQAYLAIRRGEVDQAIVCGANTTLAEGLTLQFARLGVLSKEGMLRAFDKDGQGYVRAEATSAILLQKAKDCKRIYAKVLHVKTNCDGYKEQGITYPSGEAQLNLVKEIYMESGIDPGKVSYIEAHGTGTPVGDPEELNGIDAFFVRNRTKPLLVGSVKASIGHTEPVSGLCAIVKSILAFENNLIPANINFKTPRSTIPGLSNGRMQVVAENTPFQDQNGLIGSSSFGFGGGNAHVLLKWNTKAKIGNGTPADSLARLVCISGRTEQAVYCLLDDIAEKFDVEHMALVYNSFRKPVRNHLFRGYVIASKEGVLKKSVKPFNPNKSSIHIYFGELMKSSSGNIVGDLLELPSLAEFKHKTEQFLKTKNLKLNNLISNSFPTKQSYLLSKVITQLCVAELLKLLNIEHNSVSGNSLGELACAYFERILTLDEVLNCVFSLGGFTDDMEKQSNGYSTKDEAFNNYESKLLSEFKKNIKTTQYMNGCNGTESKRKTPEYFVKVLLQNPEQNAPKIPKTSVILAVGHGLPMLTSRATHVVSIDGNDGIQGVLEALGSLYEYGANPQLQNLYSKVEFPVSRSTPIISSKIKWKHDFKYFIPEFKYQNTHKEAMIFRINPKKKMFANIVGHVIDGRNLFPGTGYLYLVWFLFGEVQCIDLSKLQVVFENCKFKRACQVPHKDSSGDLVLRVMLQRASGVFEVSEGDESVVTGQIRLGADLPAMDTNYSGKDISSDGVLDAKDIYKELNLRGYNVSGVFRSLVHVNESSTCGKIRWVDDWIAYMDNMLQIKILHEDSRLLYVPVGIERITINPIAHLELIENLKGDDEDKIVELPIEYCPETTVVRSGGIEITGLLASFIPRKKATALPVLEKYQFVPNNAKLSLHDSIRALMQVALENNCGLKVKAVELVDESSVNDAEFLGPIIQDVLGDQPLVKPEITILSGENLDVTVQVENKKISNTSENTIVVGTNLLSRKKVLEEALTSTVETGFLLSREPLNTSSNLEVPPSLTLLNIFETDKEKLIFLRKTITPQDSSKVRVYINVGTRNRNFDWVNELKSAINKDSDVVVWCQNEPLNGILGLVNCIRREPGCQNVKCLFIVDKAPDFDPTNLFYKKQLEKNMGINIYNNGQWGTYRHLLLEEFKEAKYEHCYVNSTIRGDLSSIKWMEGPLSKNVPMKTDETLINICYSSLNFRDVMIASGRINVDVITRNRREQECVQGFEFSGRTMSGKRVMGMVQQGALATLIKADNTLLWDVPANWSLEEAATVPVVYATCLYGLVVIGRIKPSDSVLIHSGTGGIGQAAINLCLHMGCTVFTTVGTNDKKQFLLKKWPQINEKHIGYSRDLSFEQMIMKQTNGRGVDIVLNSLAEEKLTASARCLAPNGRFLEIGKFDLASNNQLNLLSFKEGASYHGVMLDRLIYESASVKLELNRLLQRYIDMGAIKPLMTNVFEKSEVEQAFRFMTAGKHMGKVVVKIREENEDISVADSKFVGMPKYVCNPDKSYIICGGLGGFGLELADWLVLRGAKNLILSSRRGVVTGYQRYRISIWKSYSCNIKVSTQDITTKSGCTELLKEANNIAPVAAIFNLAVVLEDAILENQTKESFQTSFGPKAYATEYLDELSRIMCPDLKDFVVFSSVSCGRGNAGQTNYGMSNSVMERICEKRRTEGFPALAIEWGAIGDVGLVAAMQDEYRELEIGGTLQQGIFNCLQVMDTLLRQEEGCIVSSIVVAEKKIALLTGNVEEVIGAILGIRDLKSVSRHSTLAELGMDSMTAVEVKQTLEITYSIFLSPAEMRTLTLARINEMLEKTSAEDSSKTEDKASNNFGDMFNFVYEENQMSSPVCQLPSKGNKEENNNNLPKIIVFPGVEGTCDLMKNVTKNLEAEAVGFNYIPSIQKDSMQETCMALLPFIKEVLKSDNSFHIVAHSTGAVIALEVASELEKLGYLGTVTLLDGSPTFVHKLVSNNSLLEGGFSDEKLENAIIAGSLRLKFSVNEILKIMDDVHKCTTLEEKIKTILEKLPSGTEDAPSKESLLVPVTAVKKRYSSCLTYKPVFGKVNSIVRLYKPNVASAVMDTEDYDLGELCAHPVEVKVFEGTHVTFLENEKLAETIMRDLTVVNGYSHQ